MLFWCERAGDEGRQLAHIAVIEDLEDLIFTPTAVVLPQAIEDQQRFILDLAQ